MNLQQVSLIAALIQADAPLRKLDEVVFRLLQLKHIHVGSLVDGAGVEQELVGRDAEQGLCHLTDAFLVKVLQILTGQKHGGFFLSHTLQAVADVLDSSGVGQPDICLLYTSDAADD